MSSIAYNEVLEVSCLIVNASESGDTRAQWAAYQLLIEICERYENTEYDHPLQWEALADFTTEAQRALEGYEKALVLARRLGLPDHEASICLAMAERHVDLGDTAGANALAWDAHNAVRKTDDTDLSQQISAFLASQIAAT